jgi:hypothetical protein
MKIFMATLFISMMTAKVALACMPFPPNTPAFSMQKPWLNKIIASTIVFDKIQELAGKEGDVSELRATNHGYQIVLNNGCSFMIVTDFSNSSPGTCPILLPLKVVDESCQLK